MPPPELGGTRPKSASCHMFSLFLAEEKRADARSYFGAICFWRGGKGGSVFLKEKFLFKSRLREIEKSLVGFTRVGIGFVV